MLLTNAKLVTLKTDEEFGFIADGSIVLDGAHIAWVGEATDLPKIYRDQKMDYNTDSVGFIVLPYPCCLWWQSSC